MKEQNNKNVKKIIRNSSIFVLLIILTYYFIFRKMDRKGLWIALKNTNILFIIIAAILAFGNIFFEAFIHYRNLKLLKEETNFKSCLKYAIVGFFFSAITPAATGGQPVQIYYMHKDKISYTNATISVLIQSFSYLTIMVLLGIVGYIINFKYISSLSFFEYFFFIGVIANMTIVIITLIAMFNRKMSQRLLNFIYKIIDKFNHEKAVSFKEKFAVQLKEYHDGARFIMNNKKAVIKTLLTSTCQLISYHSVAFFIYLSLGVKYLSYIKITSLQSLLYLSVSILPLPGTVGVNETGFSIIYSPIITKNIVDSALLLTRGISFYLYVVITGIIILIINLYKRKKSNND